MNPNDEQPPRTPHPDAFDPSAAESQTERVVFVSRSAQGPDPEAPPQDANGRPLPGLRSPVVQVMLVAILILQGLSWWILEGYQLADSVEYMERAQAFVRGEEVIDSTSIRSFAFPSVLVPFFTLAEWFDIDDFKPVVWMVRWIQMLFGLLLVRSCMRIGARLGGRRTGLVAGFLTGMNPVFLQYSVSPVSGVAAAAFVGLAIEHLLDPPSFKRGLRAGAWMGLAVMMAYQSLLVVGPLWLALFLRDRWKGRASWLGALAGLAIGLVLQIILDKITYGVWGASVWRHFLSHIHFLALPLAHLGMLDLANALYGAAVEALDSGVVHRGDSTLEDIDRLLGVQWYFTQLPRMLVWPVIGFGLLGLFQTIKRASWKTSTLVFVFAVNVLVMSVKGSKDFRLWLPLLPAIAPICAYGADLLFGKPGQRSPAGPLFATLALLATVVLGIQTLLDRNTRRFSGYWEAMQIVDGLAADIRANAPDGDLSPKIKASSAYHWAVYLRESEDVELIKLPHHLDHWKHYTPEERQASFEAIAELDFFITHLAVLSSPEHRDLMENVNRDFEVHAMLWDQEVFEHIGPVFVLRKRTGNPDAKTFYDVIEGRTPEEYRRDLLLPPGMRFVRRLGDHLEEIDLLGWEIEELPGHGHVWITYHWYCRADIIGDYTIVDRLTTFDERNSWQNNHGPAYGVHKTSTWEPGWILRESWPVVAAANPYDWKSPFRPMGGPYRRGDLMPANLWIDLATFGAEGQITGRMEPARTGEAEPMRRGEEATVLRTTDGTTFSKDDLVRVGRMFLPVHASSRVPDDGRPLE